jgi:hypothetical protein
MVHPFSALATEIYNDVLRQANIEHGPVLQTILENSGRAIEATG